ncbi:MAG TPA: 7TM diverse intracellular signaling domain-containing protein [Bacteroidales bacterium]|nr:7TM diverse intracellular signaling domain-containing protein [Bacteroidales bacterium]
MAKSFRILVISFLYSAFSASAIAVASPVSDYNEDGEAVITRSFIFEDSTGKMTFDEIKALPDDKYLSFIGNDFLLKDNVYWIKFTIRNTTALNHVLFELRPRFRSAEMYETTQNGTIVKMKGGLGVPWSQWIFGYKNTMFPVVTHSDSSWYYIRLKSDYDTGLGLMLARYNAFIRRILPENFDNGFFFGILAIAAMFSLIFYYQLKERTYLFYSLYVISYALFASVDWGIVVKYLTYLPLKWHPDLYTVPFAMMTIFLLLYARGLLETKKKEPFLDKLIVGAIVARVIIYFTGAIFKISLLYNPSIDNLLLFSAYAGAIVKYRNGYKPARYFLIGLSFLYLGLILHSTQNTGLISYNIPTWFSMYKTGVVEMIFFSLALADRFRIMKQEQDRAQHRTIEFLRENGDLQEKMIRQLNENERLKDKLNLELEEKVKERTGELEEANNVIVEINRFLEESNRKLAGEVKKISLNRIMQKTVTFDEFREIYPDDESCYKFLEKHKWSSDFTCKKCGHTRYSTGNTPYSRRCSRCNYIERITSGTIFSHTKFPITKAFYMLFLVNSGKNSTIDQLADTLQMRKQTVWYFRKKLETAMNEAPRRKSSPDDGWSRWIITPDPKRKTKKQAS